MAKVFETLKRFMGRFNREMEKYQEAITFAESGQPEHSQSLMASSTAAEQAGKLLVLGRESNFSREVMDYALEMAQRMSYEIVALNTAPLSCDTFKKFSASQKELCRNFRHMSEEHAKTFQREAEKLGIGFQHVVKFTDREEALHEINQEIRDIEFVVSDREKASVNRAEQEDRAAQPIFVYSMIQQ